MIANLFLDIVFLLPSLITWLVSRIPPFPEVPSEFLASFETAIGFVLGYNWLLPIVELGIWIPILFLFWFALAVLQLSMYVMNYIRGK